MTYLDSIVATRRADVERERARTPRVQLEALADARGRERRDFGDALRSRRSAPAIVAEFKRASPSAGDIARDADVATVARAYEAGGAAAISVLTEKRHFKGGYADLSAARAATSLPVLCKDFIVEDHQLWCATAAGADAVLLIVAALRAGELASLLARASELRLQTLVEVHDEAEADAALAAGARIIGINNRDLRTFAVDLSTATRVARYLRAKGPADAGPTTLTIIAESGYTEPEDLATCAAAGIDAVLVGERLMRAGDPAAALRALAAGVPR